MSGKVRTYIPMLFKAVRVLGRHNCRLKRRLSRLDRAINRLIRERDNLRSAFSRQGRQNMRMQANAEAAYRCLERLQYSFPPAEQRRLIEDAKAFLILETIVPGESREAQ